MKDTEKFIDENLRAAKISLSANFADKILSEINDETSLYIDEQLAKQKLRLPATFADKVISELKRVKYVYYAKIAFSFTIAAASLALVLNVQTHSKSLDEEFFAKISEKTDEVVLLAAIISEQETLAKNL